jgi:hypothetical protein
MRRRHVLSLSGSLLPLAGCASPGTGTQTGTPTLESTPDHAENIFLVLHNETAERTTVAVTITTGNAVSFEAEVTVDSDEIRHVYPGITDRGEYELRVSLPDRPDQARPFDVEAYDLRMGSNVDIWISEDDVRIGIEE